MPNFFNPNSWGARSSSEDDTDIKSRFLTPMSRYQAIVDNNRQNAGDLQNKSAEAEHKDRAVYDDIMSRINPFLNSKGELVNKMTNYKKVLESNNLNDKTRQFIEDATGLTSDSSGNGNNGGTNDSGYGNLSGVNPDNLVNLDVATELPKLNVNQISSIISKHFSKSSVISPSDAEGIFNAQKQTGMSALAILGIGALESGYGTSAIAKAKNNLWGWGAVNSNPMGGAKSFAPVSEGAAQFASKYMNTYYNNYGAKSIHSAGTGDNPKGMGYAYYDGGGIDPSWATKVGTIMKNFYNTALGGSINSGSTPKVSNTNVPKSATGNALVDGAAEYLGVKYVWGGTTPKGFDCSGLVQYVANKNGKEVHRVSKDQYKYDGVHISKDQLQPGDLIFFDTHGNNDGNVSHVGIYAGNGQMIHAPKTGDVVKYASINSDYYTNAYVGAKRI